MIKAEIVCDSINSHDHRLTTFICTYPRFVHSEVMTHRMFSRNAASSRAIPVARMINDLLENPAMPVKWGKNQPGMQAETEIDESFQTQAEEIWLKARDSSIEWCKKLIELGLHKQIANRILEPWAHMVTLISATEWGNFFNLRCHKDAQPEFQVLAKQMLKAYTESQPKLLYSGEWHIPFGDKYVAEGLTLEQRLKIGVARAARVSYKNFEGDIDHEKDYELHDNLLKSGHFSPFEHVASAFLSENFRGNFKGFLQYRKQLNRDGKTSIRENQEIFDPVKLLG